MISLIFIVIAVLLFVLRAALTIYILYTYTRLDKRIDAILDDES